MELSGFLDVVVALALLMPAIGMLLAFFIWVATIVQDEKE
jgi:hypothetical protein